MRMPNKLIVLTFILGAIVVVPGCPSGGFFGRFVVLNSGEEPIHDLTITAVASHVVAEKSEHHWPLTLPGQGWITSSFGHLCYRIRISWITESGETREATVDFSEAVGYRTTNDLILEFQDNALEPRWRLSSSN